MTRCRGLISLLLSVGACGPEVGTVPDLRSQPDTGAAAGLELELPGRVAAGWPFVVAVRTDDGVPLTATGSVVVDGQEHILNLHRGRGSVGLSVIRAGPVEVSVGGRFAARPVALATAAPRDVDGDVAGRWEEGEVLAIRRVARVPAGAQLIVDPGVLVLLGDKASIEVHGELRMEGRADRPVLLTAKTDSPWGWLRVHEGGRASLTHAWLTSGGGDPSEAFGHSASQPVVRVDRAHLEMRGGGIVDCPGKAFGTEGATLNLDGVLVSRVDTGGEHIGGVVTIRRAHFLELPDADGRVDDDDNDGLYLGGPTPPGEESLVIDSVFSMGEDDAIDHNGAVLRVERTWIEGFVHEGIAASKQGRVHAIDTMVRGCDQGIEAGYGTPEVLVERCALTDNAVGLRFGDSYDWGAAGSLTVRRSIAVGNGQNVRNHANSLGGPRPGAVAITCSAVDTPELDGVGGNQPGEPTGPWRATGCANGPALDPDACGGGAAGLAECFPAAE